MGSGSWIVCGDGMFLWGWGWDGGCSCRERGWGGVGGCGVWVVGGVVVVTLGLGWVLLVEGVGWLDFEVVVAELVVLVSVVGVRVRVVVLVSVLRAGVRFGMLFPLPVLTPARLL